MSSPGIDKWIEKAPESWAKLAKKTSKKTTFEQFKKKFFEGAENENKAYLKKYLDDDKLRKIYEQGAGGAPVKIKDRGGTPTPVKPKVIQVIRKGKVYTRNNTARWDSNLSFTLKLAAKSKPKSKEYEKYVQALIAQGRTRQAAVKKIQRTRRELNEQSTK